MTPFQIAKNLYEKEPQPFTFEQDLERFAEFGYVFSTPDSFIMGYFEDDTWFIYCFAGNLADAFRFLPHKSKYVAFIRRGSEPRTYSYEAIKKRVEKTRQQEKTTKSY